jgi:hypothetical protein
VADDDERRAGPDAPSRPRRPTIRASWPTRGDRAGRPQRSGSVEIAVDDAPSAATGAPRRRRATTAALALTGHVVHAADRVAAVADVVGGKIGDVVGESLTHLPGVPRTRKASVMARGVVVGFCLVFAWIAVIVGLQLRGRHPPDFRPDAERVLAALRDGQFSEVYRDASARMQEVVLEDTFIVQMTDLNGSLGRFREVTSVVHTEINRGPGGRTGRVDLRLAYEHAATRGSMSFRWEDGQWKLMGLSVEVPEALLAVVGTAEARRDRVAGNQAELRALVTNVLTLSSAGKAEELYRSAAPGFQDSIFLEDFERTIERYRALGNFHRVLNITWAQLSPSHTTTSVECLVEFDNATINTSFKFVKIDGVWRMAKFKLVLPLPREPR